MYPQLPSQSRVTFFFLAMFFLSERSIQVFILLTPSLPPTRANSPRHRWTEAPLPPSLGQGFSADLVVGLRRRLCWPMRLDAAMRKKMEVRAGFDCRFVWSDLIAGLYCALACFWIL
ncbi:hypothetical protein BRADI_1g36169v3 [Brachypodium distachyon]|uniref:Uncharacterized protein n=1 Tax=Brachypodium distachyon TaxID=15368 RepID=A0A2K2DMZ7_BRADI|nr:hypothetical protein BRADI_1g36169v3 [Brachypodium distachyon]